MTQAIVSARSEGESLERVCEALEARGARLEDAAVWHVGRRVAGELARAHATTDEEGMPAPKVHLRLCAAQVWIGQGGEVDLVWPTPGEEEDALDWMAPEQRGGGRVTHRADVYRLGLLLWSMLAGRPPRPGDARLPAIAALRPELPGDLAAAIDAALEPVAGRRTITCVELEQWIEPLDRGEAGRQRLADHLRLVDEEEEASPETLEEEPLGPPSSPFVAPAPLPAARPDPGSRRLSPLQSIGVAALTAALVFGIGTYFGDRAIRGPQAPPPLPPEGP